MVLRVAALLLAAGSSRRMGTSKQLLRLGDRSVVRRCFDAIVAAGIQHVVVVAGAPGDGIAEEFAGTSATIARNNIPNSQMADSVKKGLSELHDLYPGVLVCLSDHPLITTETFRAVIQAHQNAPHKIIIPVYGKGRGHPTLFPLPALKEIESGATLRDIIRKDEGRVSLIEVPDEGVVLDMDTVDDYQRVRERFTAGCEGGLPEL